jgi:hypothetical protein
MQFEPKDYLEHVFPALLRASTVPPPKETTVVQLVLADLDGADWFYEISERGVEAKRGISDRVDLTLSFYSKDLAALSENTLDVAKATRTRRIKVMGDASVLRWLSRRLEVQS